MPQVWIPKTEILRQQIEEEGIASENITRELENELIRQRLIKGGLLKPKPAQPSRPTPQPVVPERAIEPIGEAGELVPRPKWARRHPDLPPIPRTVGEGIGQGLDLLFTPLHAIEAWGKEVAPRLLSPFYDVGGVPAVQTQGIGIHPPPWQKKAYEEWKAPWGVKGATEFAAGLPFYMAMGKLAPPAFWMFKALKPVPDMGVVEKAFVKAGRVVLSPMVATEEAPSFVLRAIRTAKVPKINLNKPASAEQILEAERVARDYGYNLEKELPNLRGAVYEKPLPAGTTAAESRFLETLTVKEKQFYEATLKRKAEVQPPKFLQKQATFKEVNDWLNKIPRTEIKAPFDMSFKDSKKAAAALADELAEFLGKAEVKPPTVRGVPEPKGLWSGVANKYKTYIAGTDRLERIFFKHDGYVRNGKLTQAFWWTVDKATDRFIPGFYGTRTKFNDFAKSLGLDFVRLAKQKIRLSSTMTINRLQAMGIYAHTLNPRNFNHLMNGTFLDVVGNANKRRVIDAIVNNLTDKEKQLVMWTYRHWQEDSPKVIDAYYRATGKHMKMETPYVPIISRSESEWSVEQVLQKEATYRYTAKYPSAAQGKGWAITRKPRASGPIELDIVNMFNTRLRQLEHMKAWGEPIRDLQRIALNPKFAKAFIKKGNQAEYDVLKNWLKQVNMVNPLGSNADEAMMRMFRIRAGTAALGWNIVTFGKQLPSWMIGSMRIGTNNAIKGLVSFAENPKETMNLMRQYSPQMWARKQDLFFAEEEIAKDVISQVTGKWNTRKLFMFMTVFGDRVVVSSLWRGAYDNALRKGMNPTTAANYATRNIRITQPWWGVKDVAEFYRSLSKSGEFLKTLTMFTNQLNQYWNYGRYELYGAWRAKQISTPQALRELIQGFIVSALMIGSISRGRLPQDPQEALTDVGAMGLAMVPLVGNWGAAAIRGGAEPGLISTEVLDRAYRMAFQVNRGEWEKALLAFPELVAYAGGFPASQPMRTLEGILDLSQGKSDDWMRLIYSEYTRKTKKPKRSSINFELP